MSRPEIPLISAERRGHRISLDHVSLAGAKLRESVSLIGKPLSLVTFE